MARITPLGPEEFREFFPASAEARRLRTERRYIHLTTDKRGRERLYIGGKQQPADGPGRWKVKTIAKTGAQWPTTVAWTMTIDGIQTFIVPLGTVQPAKLETEWRRDPTEKGSAYGCFVGGWAGAIDNTLRIHDRLGVLEIYDRPDFDELKARIPAGDVPLDRDACIVRNLKLNEEVLNATIDEYTRYERFGA